MTDPDFSPWVLRGCLLTLLAMAVVMVWGDDITRLVVAWMGGPQ